VKPQLQRLFRQEEAERRANYKHMENHLYECLYDVLRSNAPARDKLPALQAIKLSCYVFTLSAQIKSPGHEGTRST